MLREESDDGTDTSESDEGEVIHHNNELPEPLGQGRLALGILIFPDGSTQEMTQAEVFAYYGTRLILDFLHYDLSRTELIGFDGDPAQREEIVRAIAPANNTFLPRNAGLPMYKGPIYVYKFISEDDDTWDSWWDISLLEVSQLCLSFTDWYNDEFDTELVAVDLTEVLD